MSNLDSLPIAPEFIEALAENAIKTALDYLAKIKADPELITLVENISNFGYYLASSYRNPEVLMGDAASRFGIEEMVVETVNAIVKLDGAFQGPYGGFLPRKEAIRMMRQGAKTIKRPTKKAKG